jgi:hypothetical protein
MLKFRFAWKFWFSCRCQLKINFRYEFWAVLLRIKVNWDVKLCCWVSNSQFLKCHVSFIFKGNSLKCHIPQDLNPHKVLLLLLIKIWGFCIGWQCCWRFRGNFCPHLRCQSV